MLNGEGIDLRRVRYFVQVAEVGSLSNASDVLRIAQPALSRQMRLLEQELGVTLFRRTRRGMQLTEEGEEFRARVIGPLRTLTLAFNDARSSSGSTFASVAVGILPTVSAILAEPLVRRVAETLPMVALRVVEGDGGHLLEWLLRGDIDIAILDGPGLASDRLLTSDLVMEDLMLVGPPDCRLSSDRPLSFGELTALPLILPSVRHGIRGIVEKAAARTKSVLNIRFQIDSFQLQKSLVTAGLGFTILPYSSFAAEAEQGRLKFAPIHKPNLTRHLVTAGRPECSMPRVMINMDGLIRGQVADLLASGKWRAKSLMGSVEG